MDDLARRSQKPATRKSGKEIQELSRILIALRRAGRRSLQAEDWDIRFVRRDVIE